MPRKTDTRDKVFDAADALLQEGIRPTQQNVRERIGSGSLSTINSALNAWWSSLSDRLNRKDSHPELPDPVISAANQLWDQALAYAHHALQKERNELSALLAQQKGQGAEQLEQLRKNIDQLQAQNTELRIQCDQLRTEQSDLTQKLLSTETALIRAQSERDDLKRMNKQLELLQSRQQAPSNSADIEKYQQQLFDAKVDAKVNISKINELTNLLNDKSDECTQLKMQLLNAEREAIQQKHRLELVIAQQDTRYDDALQALSDCKAELSLAKSNLS
jgi:chromosome segregation ATPase